MHASDIRSRSSPLLLVLVPAPLLAVLLCRSSLSSHPSSLDVCSCSSSTTMALFDATHVRMLYWLLLLCKNAHQTMRKVLHASALANLIHQAFLRKRVFRWERIIMYICKYIQLLYLVCYHSHRRYNFLTYINLTRPCM